MFDYIPECPLIIDGSLPQAEIRGSTITNNRKHLEIWTVLGLDLVLGRVLVASLSKLVKHYNSDDGMQWLKGKISTAEVEVSSLRENVKASATERV